MFYVHVYTVYQIRVVLLDNEPHFIVYCLAVLYTKCIYLLNLHSLYVYSWEVRKQHKSTQTKAYYIRMYCYFCIAWIIVTTLIYSRIKFRVGDHDFEIF